jgi:energy-coupling factor transport system ATP-binding protein
LIRQEESRTAVTLTGIRFSYQDRNVLTGIDLTVPAGSYCGIVGPNGCGKTTLAYIISGILFPQSGALDIHGHKIGLVLSNPANQIVSLVVEEDIAFGPENMGFNSREIRERIDFALDAVHGDHLRQSLTSTLSGGQLAKIAFAGQIALDADVLVMDEGTIMLDPMSRKALLSTLRELNTGLGKTIIHISHRLEDLENATCVCLMQEGRITMQRESALALISDLKNGPGLPGIEPGSHLLYQSFLKDLGIHEKDLESATKLLAEKIVRVPDSD